MTSLQCRHLRAPDWTISAQNGQRTEAWAGADLMIKGLGLAGASPTRASTITALRGITSYNDNGLLPNSFDYSTNFGHNPAQTCAWIMKAETNGFTAISATPTCGTDLPHTSTATSS